METMNTQYAYQPLTANDAWQEGDEWFDDLHQGWTKNPCKCEDCINRYTRYRRPISPGVDVQGRKCRIVDKTAIESWEASGVDAPKEWQATLNGVTWNRNFTYYYAIRTPIEGEKVEQNTGQEICPKCKCIHNPGMNTLCDYVPTPIAVSSGQLPEASRAFWMFEYCGDEHWNTMLFINGVVDPELELKERPQWKAWLYAEPPYGIPPAPVVEKDSWRIWFNEWWKSAKTWVVTPESLAKNAIEDYIKHASREQMKG